MQERAQKIRERAHAIWEQEGRPHGREREHWVRAEQEVDAEPLGGGTAAGLEGEGMLASPGSAAELPPDEAEPKRRAGTRKRSTAAGEGAKAKKPTAAKTRK